MSSRKRKASSKKPTTGAFHDVYNGRLKTGRWRGSWKEGRPYGEGTFLYPEKGSENKRYDGHLAGDLFQGYGVLQLKSGEVMKGMWENHRLTDEHANWTSADGCVEFNGQMREDRFVRGELRTELYTFTGEFNNGRAKNGRLVYNNPSREHGLREFVGSFEDDDTRTKPARPENGGGHERRVLDEETSDSEESEPEGLSKPRKTGTIDSGAAEICIPQPHGRGLCMYDDYLPAPLPNLPHCVYDGDLVHGRFSGSATIRRPVSSAVLRAFGQQWYLYVGGVDCRQPHGKGTVHCVVRSDLRSSAEFADANPPELVDVPAVFIVSTPVTTASSSSSSLAPSSPITPSLNIPSARTLRSSASQKQRRVSQSELLPPPQLPPPALALSSSVADLPALTTLELPAPLLAVTYFGRLRSSFKSGVGIEVTDCGSRRYEGNFQRDDFHGLGRWSARVDNDYSTLSFMGIWLRSVPHGPGRCVSFLPGLGPFSLSGEFKQGHLSHGIQCLLPMDSEGKDQLSEQDRVLYRGSFLSSEYHGLGTLNLNNVRMDTSLSSRDKAGLSDAIFRGALGFPEYSFDDSTKPTALSEQLQHVLDRHSLRLQRSTGSNKLNTADQNSDELLYLLLNTSSRTRKRRVAEEGGGIAAAWSSPKVKPPEPRAITRSQKRKSLTTDSSADHEKQSRSQEDGHSGSPSSAKGTSSVKGTSSKRPSKQEMSRKPKARRKGSTAEHSGSDSDSRSDSSEENPVAATSIANGSYGVQCFLRGICHAVEDMKGGPLNECSGEDMPMLLSPTTREAPSERLSVGAPLRYEGQFERGNFDGQGTLHWSNGRLVGSFRGNCCVGDAEIFYRHCSGSGWDSYKGVWTADRLECTLPSGTVRFGLLHFCRECGERTRIHSSTQLPTVHCLSRFRVELASMEKEEPEGLRTSCHCWGAGGCLCGAPPRLDLCRSYGAPPTTWDTLSTAAVSPSLLPALTVAPSAVESPPVRRRSSRKRAAAATTATATATAAVAERSEESAAQLPAPEPAPKRTAPASTLSTSSTLTNELVQLSQLVTRRVLTEPEFQQCKGILLTPLASTPASARGIKASTVRLPPLAAGISKLAALLPDNDAVGLTADQFNAAKARLLSSFAAAEDHGMPALDQLALQIQQLRDLARDGFVTSSEADVVLTSAIQDYCGLQEAAEKIT